MRATCTASRVLFKTSKSFRGDFENFLNLTLDRDSIESALDENWIELIRANKIAHHRIVELMNKTERSAISVKQVRT